MTQSVINNVLGWLRAGYPQGIPEKDYFPLLALLVRTLTEDEVVDVARTVLKNTESDTVTIEEIRAAIQQVTDKEPNQEEMRQVAARLASVGWPLAGSER